MRNAFIGFAIILGLVGFAPAAVAQSSGRITIAVSGLRSGEGVVRCGLYDTADKFRKPGQEMRGVVARPDGQRAACVFNGIPPGSYAVAVFHAEKNETQLEYGMFGKPKQGYGFSRNPSSTFGPPDFNAAAFNYAGGNQTLPVTLQY
jgi:uncharacterized protein (DUF2141 family)